MDDPPHIALVNTHTKGNRSANHLEVVVDEIALDAQLLLGGHARMKRLGIDAQRAQTLGHVLGVLAAKAVDDAALPLVSLNEVDNALEFLPPAHAAHHTERDIGPVKRLDEHLGIANAQLLAQVDARQAVGSSRESHDGHPRETLLDKSQLGVLGPEVMPPVRDAMRLVDSDEADEHVARPLVHVGN